MDNEHALVREALDVIDNYYYDSRNDNGASDSSLSHTYNGIQVVDIQAAEDARKLASREASYKEIRKIIKVYLSYLIIRHILLFGSWSIFLARQFFLCGTEGT